IEKRTEGHEEPIREKETISEVKEQENANLNQDIASKQKMSADTFMAIWNQDMERLASDKEPSSDDVTEQKKKKGLLERLFGITISSDSLPDEIKTAEGNVEEDINKLLNADEIPESSIKDADKPANRSKRTKKSRQTEELTNWQETKSEDASQSQKVQGAIKDKETLPSSVVEREMIEFLEKKETQEIAQDIVDVANEGIGTQISFDIQGDEPADKESKIADDKKDIENEDLDTKDEVLGDTLAFEKSSKRNDKIDFSKIKDANELKGFEDDARKTEIREQWSTIINDFELDERSERQRRREEKRAQKLAKKQEIKKNTGEIGAGKIELDKAEPYKTDGVKSDDEKSGDDKANDRQADKDRADHKKSDIDKVADKKNLNSKTLRKKERVFTTLAIFLMCIIFIIILGIGIRFFRPNSDIAKWINTTFGISSSVYQEGSPKNADIIENVKNYIANYDIEDNCFIGA
ncbi:MAG: hypothetical protein HUJ63_07880, partial [Enterococcus sp.]|nr:hypothetical protein [Enterococcus sp.]